MTVNQSNNPMMYQDPIIPQESFYNNNNMVNNNYQPYNFPNGNEQFPSEYNQMYNFQGIPLHMQMNQGYGFQEQQIDPTNINLNSNFYGGQKTGMNEINPQFNYMNQMNMNGKNI